MKEDLENVTKNYNNITSLARIEDLYLRKLKHQEGPSLPGMKILFLVITMFAKTLGTKQFIVKPMQEITI